MIKKLIEEKKEAKRREARRNTIKNVSIAATVATSVGVIGGTIGGILFAPKSGKETREDIKNKAIETNKTIKVKANELKENINVELKNTQESLIDAKSRIQAYLEEKKAERLAKTTEVDAIDKEIALIDDVDAAEDSAEIIIEEDSKGSEEVSEDIESEKVI